MSQAICNLLPEHDVCPLSPRAEKLVAQATAGAGVLFIACAIYEPADAFGYLAGAGYLFYSARRIWCQLTESRHPTAQPSPSDDS